MFTRNAWQKINQMLNNTVRRNFCHLKIIHILHTRYHPKKIGHIKNKQKNKYVGIHIINHNENEK